MTKLKTVETTALIAAEVAYLGSFIRDENYMRDKDFYSHRSMMQKPEDMHDEISSALMETIIRLYTRNEDPNPENIAHVMMTEGLITPDTPGIAGEATAWQDLMTILEYYAMRGAKTLKEFRSRERAVRENWRTDKMSPAAISQMLAEARKTSTSSVDMALAIRAYADTLIGDSEVHVKTADWNEQKRILTEIPQRQRNLLGQPRFTFPPHWGLNSLIPVIRPGEKIVLSGATGDGKSACAMQFAEWACIVGKNVLVIHMEDTDETILMRQTVRWIGGTLEELEKGDPRGKMDDMIKLREKWAEDRSGSITYRYLAGLSVPLIAEHIKEVARILESEDKTLDVVVMDYFQKADFDTNIKPGQNYVNVATAGAESLKILAQQLKLVMLVVSQETSDGNGGKHTAWTKALEQKPQIYISLTRREIRKTEDEEWVEFTDGIVRKRVPLAKVGDRSCWLEFHVKKANQSRQGVVWNFFEGPRFRAFEPNFMKQVEAGERNEFEVPVLTEADQAFWNRQEKYLESYRKGWKTLQNPEEKRREALQNGE